MNTHTVDFYLKHTLGVIHKVIYVSTCQGHPTDQHTRGGQLGIGNVTIERTIEQWNNNNTAEKCFPIFPLCIEPFCDMHCK